MDLTQREVICIRILDDRYPELIIQIESSLENQEILQNMICNVTLIDSESLDDRTIVQRPSRKNAIPGTGMNENGDYYINLLGNRVALATRLLDPINRNYKYFFNFPDLKVRVRGRYRFNCMIIVPGEYSNNNAGVYLFNFNPMFLKSFKQMNLKVRATQQN